MASSTRTDITLHAQPMLETLLPSGLVLGGKIESGWRCGRASAATR